MGNNEDSLRLFPLFHDLTAEEMKRVWNLAIPRSFNKKAIIFTEGSHKEAIFFVMDGLIKAYKTDENGQEHIVSFLKTGQMFPHTGFFNQDPYPATTEAIVTTRVLAIPVHAFEQLIIDMPEISIKLLRVLSNKIKELQGKLQDITGNDVQDRGQLFLIHLAENYGTYENDHIYINVPMTNQEFANAIGTTRETVNRFINQLRKENIIEKNRRGYVILDFEALKNWQR